MFALGFIVIFALPFWAFYLPRRMFYDLQATFYRHPELVAKCTIYIIIGLLSAYLFREKISFSLSVTTENEFLDGLLSLISLIKETI